ncbi:hypothetical protein GCM10009610_38280 [Pseudonocardia xinjiangensis]
MRPRPREHPHCDDRMQHHLPRSPTREKESPTQRNADVQLCARPINSKSERFAVPPCDLAVRTERAVTGRPPEAGRALSSGTTGPDRAATVAGPPESRARRRADAVIRSAHLGTGVRFVVRRYWLE